MFPDRLTHWSVLTNSQKASLVKLLPGNSLGSEALPKRAKVHHPPKAREARLLDFSRKQEIFGEGGIRTPGTLSGTPVFKTGAIGRSATSPDVLVARKT